MKTTKLTKEELSKKTMRELMWMAEESITNDEVRKEIRRRAILLGWAD